MTPPPPLRLYWWRPAPPHRGNFGDELSPYLMEVLFGYRTVWAEPDTCELAAVGSIIEFLLSTKGKNRPVLWGSGLFSASSDPIAAGEFDISALRGVCTRTRLANVESDVALGDPGLLAHVLIDAPVRKRQTLGIVPHYLDADLPAVARLRTWRDVAIIDVTKPAPEVVREIAQCHYVLSSSLHGLVVADSVGTPNGYVAFSANAKIGGRSKFLDYYSVFADPDRQLALPLAEVLASDTRSVAAELARRYREPADLTAITDGLIKAFPR